MACRLFSAKPLSKPMLFLSIVPLETNFSESLMKNTTLFIHENASENIVCETAAILSRERCTKSSSLATLGYFKTTTSCAAIVEDAKVTIFLITLLRENCVIIDIWHTSLIILSSAANNDPPLTSAHRELNNGNIKQWDLKIMIYSLHIILMMLWSCHRQ